MGSTRCRHFVQNAWKKDLCSNCFKGRDEHAAPVRLVPRVIVPSLPPPQGILKGQKWTRSKTHRVYFPAEECEVIGEGGEDAGPPSDDDSDDQDDADWGKPVVEDDPQEQEQARLLQALTRSNTDFNSIAANLESAAPPPAAAKQGSGKASAKASAAAAGKQRAAQSGLQLGRPQTDAEGRKQTLLVSVQPFGKPAAAATPAVQPAAVQPEHVTKIPVATPPSSAPCNGVVLKSIVHTGEDAPIAPTPLPATKVPSSDVPAAAAATPDPAAPTLLKLNDAQPGKPVVAAAAPAATASAAPLSSKTMFLKSFVEPAEPTVVCLSATAVPDGPASPAKSPAGTTTTSSSAPSAARTPPASPVKTAPASPVKTTPPSPAKSSPARPASPVRTPPASPAKTAPASPAKTTATVTSATTVTGGSAARREGKRTHITRGTPISKNNEMLLKTKFIPLRTSTIINNNNNKRNSEDGKHRGDPVMLIEAKQLDSSDEDDRPYSNVQVQSHKSMDDAPGAQTKRLASLLAPLGSPLGVADVAGMVGSREMAGEPDGRADPDSSSESGSEPPALPQSPPPAVDPRPSFLHGLTARLAANNNAASIAAAVAASGGASPAAEKPRVPFKSSTVVQAATAQQLHQQRWSQVISSQAAKTVTAVEPPQAPSCSPPCTPDDTPASSASSSPLCSPHGTPPSDSCSRQKRQAPQPPQEQPSSPVVVYAATPVAPSPPPVKEAAAAPPMRPALGRSASTASSTSTSSSPSASPPSPVLAYHRKASVPAASPVSRQKDKEKQSRRSSQHLLVAPLPPLAPTRSESVPSALGQVALGHSVTLGAHSGHSIAQALAQANSFVSMSPNAGQGQPQPSPRRALSMSTDSLSGGGSPTKHPMMYDTERKKPGTKVRFSLRKFLGLSKDASSLRDAGPGLGFPDSSLSSLGSPADVQAPPQPRPRPRLEIIHPSDLSGRGVEVLRASGVEVRRQMQEQAAQAAQAAAVAAPLRRNSDAASALCVVDGAGLSCGSLAADYDNGGKGRPSKPPPPPRSQSLENDVTLGASPSRPSRPPPPKSAHVDLLMRRHSPTAAPSPTPGPAAGHSVYANIAPAAEALSRSNVAPTKPQRTGSVRDATGDSPRRTPNAAAATPTEPVKHQEAATRSCSLSSQPEDSGYESVELSDSAQPQSMTDSENVYECVNSTGERSSSPECDSKTPGPANGEASVGAAGAPLRPGSGSTSTSGSGSGAADRPASSSTHYCGSETESDIYSPYSFYGGSEEGDEGEADSAWKWRSRARKGRSVVHKSMEDNYDAVVGANLEALAQLFEQIRTGPTVPTALRPLKTSSALNWCDFVVTHSPSQQSPGAPVVAGRWVFLPAHWDGQLVTLGVLPDGSAGCAKAWRGGGRGAFPFALMPITEFCDRVPASCLPAAASASRPAGAHLEALVAVLARARVDTLASYGAWLRAGGSSGTGTVEADEDAAWREAGLALLQLLNALLALQALRQDQEVHADSVVFLRDPGQAQAAAQSHDEHHDATPQLALLHGMGTAAATDADVARSLCACALAGVRALLPAAPPSPLLCSLLEAKASDDEAEPSAASEAFSNQQGGLALAKAVLEYWLWGPAEAVSSLAALQRWLDLERATVLHRLVCARAAAGPHHRLAIQQQSHLLFLVHTSAATMCDASRLLDAARVSPLETTS